MKQKKYKFALFDWDGCLADTLSNAKRIYRLLANKNNIELNDVLFKEIFGDWKKSAKVLAFENDEALKSEYSDLVEQSISLVGFNKNAKEILKTLKSLNVPIGIVTSSSRNWIIEQATQQGAIDYLDQVVGFEDVVNTKPDPEPIYKLLDLLDAEKELSVLIGDTEKDIIAASNAQIDSIWYAPESNLEVYGEMDFGSSRPTYKIEDLSELERYFAN